MKRKKIMQLREQGALTHTVADRRGIGGTLSNI